tara:strand:+ start:1407 stop:2768 length:1362 start_codon:yes stop_codon:yes gene_type:complete
MSFAGPSNYKTLRIDKSIVSDSIFSQTIEAVDRDSYSFNTKTAEVEGKTVRFDYFESIYSPMVTAKTTIVDTGDSAIDERDNLATIRDGFPIVGDGTEFITFEIVTGSGTLTTKQPMAVTGAPITLDQNQRQILTLPLVSKYSIDVASKPRLGYYGIGTIDEAVKKILKENNLPFLEENIEKSSTLDKVDGKNETPIDLIFHLSKKTKPVTGAPGFFFYETQEGFNFRSIEGLIEQGMEDYKNNRTDRTYTYSNNQRQDPTAEDNYKLVKMPVIKRDQNLITALKTGVYNVRIQTKNLLTGQFTDNIVNLLDKNSTYLGNKPSVKPNQNETTPSNYSRTYSYVLTPGSLDEGVSTKITNNPAEYEPQANMRYAMLHSQIVDIQIPCNVRLMAGNVIKLLIENVSSGNKTNQVDNPTRSGFYLILHLHHHFDPKHSYTSLTLARDTYGLYTNNK